MLFKFGNQKSIINVLFTTLLFGGIIFSVSKCTGISENQIKDVTDEVNRKYLKNSDINEQIIKNPDLLNRRIRRDVDGSINRFEREEEKTYVPIMKNEQILQDAKRFRPIEKMIIEDAVYYELPTDESTAQQSLGGPMGIRAAWIEPHINEISQ